MLHALAREAMLRKHTCSVLARDTGPLLGRHGRRRHLRLLAIHVRQAARLAQSHRAQHESLSFLSGLRKLSLPGDFGFEVVFSKGYFGGEGVISEGIVSLGKLLSVHLDLPFVSRSGPVDLQTGELLKVCLDLQGFSWVVGSRDLGLSHTGLEFSQ